MRVGLLFLQCQRVLEPDERLARAAYYLAWISEAEELADVSARLYVVVAELFPPDEFLATFSRVWPEVEQHNRARFDAHAASNAPTVFGVDAYWRKANARRDSVLDGIKQGVLGHWRNGGSEVGDARSDFLDSEYAITALTQQAIRHEGASATVLVDAARNDLAERSASNPNVSRKHSRAEIESWVSASIRPDLVPEARRRSVCGAAGKVIASTLAEFRANGMSPAEVSEARETLVEAILAPDAPTTASAAPAAASGAVVVRLRECRSCRTKNRGDAYKCSKCGDLMARR